MIILDYLIYCHVTIASVNPKLKVPGTVYVNKS